MILIKRLISLLPVLFGVSTLSFCLLHVIPGDPVDVILGDQASAVDKNVLRTDLGLDQPLYKQYAKFYINLAHFDFGRSLVSRRPIRTLIVERLPATVELAISALLIAICIGIPLGIFAAISKSKILSRGLHLLSLFGMSVPTFWSAAILVLVFAVWNNWFPISDRGGLSHLVLPAITLAIGMTAALLQTARASMLRVLDREYITVAKAKGASNLRVYGKHAFMNAIIPVLTVIGLQAGAVLTGAIIVETIFDWPGIGTLLLQSIQSRDYPTVQACTLLIAFVYVAIGFLIDVSYTYANPKISFV